MYVIIIASFSIFLRLTWISEKPRTSLTSSRLFFERISLWSLQHFGSKTKLVNSAPMHVPKLMEGRQTGDLQGRFVN